MQAIYLTELTWPDVEQLLADDDRLIIVTGATEQHGRHLPLGTDNFIPMALAERLSARTGVPIAPVINIGMSESHMGFPGTFTFTTDTLKSVYLEVVQSAYRNGWRRLFVINGHGGNIAAWKWVATLAMKIKNDLKIDVSHWWQDETMREYVRQVVGRNEGHAGLEESAAMLVARPNLVKLPSGAIGENPAELGEKMLNLLVEQYEKRWSRR